ncbi:MDR family MFS transporter [Labrys neptuniae]
MTQSEPASTALSPHEVRSIIIGVLVAMFLAALDQTIVATAMPTIGRVLGDFENLPWVVTIYLLTSTAVTPLYGKMADIAGRRGTLLVAIGTFMAGSIACALAPTMLTLILARALQGLGGGGLISLAQTIIADIIPPRERARYQAYFATVFVASSIAGPVLGGFIAEKLHWSVIFWINLPLGLAALWMTNGVLKKLPRHERPHKLDFLGSGLMAFATIALLLSLSLGGPHYPWTSAPILSLLVLSILLWIGFIVRLRTAPEPLIPTEILANPVVAAGTTAACFGMGVFIGMTIYMPILLEGVYGLTASQSGLGLIPMMVGTVTGATLSGRLMARIKHYKYPPLVGLTVSTLAFALAAIRPQELPLFALEILMTAASMGIGTMLPVTTVAIQNAVLQHQMGTATGAMNFFRSLGGALIVAVFGAIVMGGLPSDLAANVTIETLAKSLAASGSDIGSVFRYVFLAATAGAFATLLALYRMEERPLRTKIEPASMAME